MITRNGNVGIGTSTPNTSSILDITSTDKGFLIPRMTTAQKETITSPTVGLMVYDTDTNTVETYDSFWGWIPVANRNEWMRKWGMEYWNDFGLNNSFTDGVLTTFSINGGGHGNTTNPTPLSSQPYIGLQGLRTGLNSNGSARLTSDVNIGRYMFNNNGRFEFETRIYIRTLSNSTDRYNIIAGLSSNNNSTTTFGCVFVYDEGGVGTGNIVTPNWQIVTAVNSVRSVFDTGILVESNTFYKFRLTTNPTWTEVKYFINDTLVRTETSNIPVNYNNGNIQVSISKSAGNTDIVMLVDYVGIKKKFITPR